MGIERPERASLVDDRLVMFFQEKQITREVSWAGFGFQIWLQLLTHIIRARNADLIVVDEPEIYLHLDLQRRIVQLLRQAGQRVLLATHSVEILNEVDPSEVLLVDRAYRSARRLQGLPGLERATEVLGSSQNVYLTRLARSRRVLFVEGRDRRLLARIAAKCDCADLFDTGDLAIISLDGFSEYRRISHAQWVFAEILKEGKIRCAALFDRDYRCSAEIQQVIDEIGSQVQFVHVWSKKEIENYLLVPTALDRVITSRLQRRVESGTLKEMPELDIYGMLTDLTTGMRSDVEAQRQAKMLQFFRSDRRDQATLLREHNAESELIWKDLGGRLDIVPGKEVLTTMNQHISEKWHISFSAEHLASTLRKEEIDTEIVSFFQRLRAALVD